MSDGLENLIVHSYDWKTDEDPETGNTVIHCWAMDRNSKPHLIRFHDFDCFCYIELPMFLNNSLVRWEGTRAKLVYDSICYLLGDDKPYRYKYEQKKKLYFYKGHNKLYPMLLVCFKSVKAMQTCKNKLKNPIRVRGLRGGNEETIVPVRVWESDIPVVRKMLTLKNCNYCQWFSVKALKLKGDDKIATIENEYIGDWKTISPIDMKETLTWTTQPTVFSFDIETYSDRHNALPDPLCARHVAYMVSIVYYRVRDPSSRRRIIILLGDCHPTEMAEVIKVKTEIELLETFQKLILELDPDIVIGYNILGYDNPYLENRLKRRMKDWMPLGRIKGKPTNMESISWSSSAYKNQDFNILSMDGRITLDLYPIVKRDYKLPVYKLDFVAKYFLKRGKHDVNAKEMFQIFELQSFLKDNAIIDKSYIPEIFIEHCKKKDIEDEDRVFEAWKAEHKDFALSEMKRVVDYCVVDSDLVIDLFEKINVWISVIQMATIMGITPMDIFMRGTGIRMSSLMFDEAFKSGIVLDEVDFPKMEYEGGFVYDPIPGLYRYIACFDFSSLYPSIMRAYNIDHTTCVPPELMDSIPDEMCHVIEWTEEVDSDTESSDSESDTETDSDSEDEGGKVKAKKVEKKKKVITHRYKFVKKEVVEGLMPRLLGRLIDERNKVRAKQKEVEKEGGKDSLEYAILEQTQLGIKIICNSFYGSCGSSFSKLRLPYASSSITAKARESTKKMNAYLEEKGYKIVYGDSVTGDTPLLLRATLSDGSQKIFFRPISRITDGILMWEKDKFTGKEYCVNFGNLEVWSDKGFTKIKHVMRHKTNKKIYRITSHTGVVKVTEDHSLLNHKGEEVTPNQVKIKDELLTRALPELPKEGVEIEEAWAWGIFYGDGSCGYYNCDSGNKASWAINNLNLDFLNNAKNILEKRYPHLKFKILDTVGSSGVYKLVPVGKGIKKFVEEWRYLFYDPVTKYKKVPDIIWRSSENTRIQFYNGYYSADGDKDETGCGRFDNKGQIGAAGLFFLSRSLGYKVSCNTRTDKKDIYRLTLTKSYQRKSPGCIKKIENLGEINDYVYDLETENHHFSAGVGELVVHNTDSTMPDLNITDPTKAWEIAEKVCKELTALFPPPMNVELEAIFDTMLSIKKKMYLCIYMDKKGNPIEDPDKMKIRGVTLARRDNCEYQRNFYKTVVWKVMHNSSFMETFDYIIDNCLALVTRQVSWEKLTMIKGLGSNYKSKSYMMAVFSEEMQKGGNPLTPGDRITYLVVKTGNEIKDLNKVGYKMRTPDIFEYRANSDQPEHIDYLYYLEKTVRNGIEKQLFQVGYKKELENLAKEYKEKDLKKFLDVFSSKNEHHRNIVAFLMQKHNDDKEAVADALLNSDFQKIARPLYNYHVRRRQGRGRRLSTRIDKEPIMMMVRLMYTKASVMKSIREYNGKLTLRDGGEERNNAPKRVILKILPNNNNNNNIQWIKEKTEKLKLIVRGSQ